MERRSNKARRDKDSILADTKNLLLILHPAIQRMPKIERIGALHEAISPEWWAFCRWNAGRQCLAFLPRYTINERLNQEFHLHLKRHGK